MDLDDVWRTIDQQRTSLADLFDDLAPSEWESPSLCTDWRVRDVAAHLTLAHTGLGGAAVNALRARGSFNRMIRDTALRQARLPVDSYAPALRAMVGSRRKAPGITPLEPLTDVLVHGQDITVPLGRDRQMPHEAAAVAADRVWSTGFPFRARRRLAGLHLRATDHTWEVGEGELVEGPVAAMLLLLTGRLSAAVPLLAGPGTARLGSADAR